MLSLSLRRRVPDDDLARMYDIDAGEVARRRAGAIDRLSGQLGIQRGEELGAVLVEEARVDRVGLLARDLRDDRPEIGEAAVEELAEDDLAALGLHLVSEGREADALGHVQRQGHRAAPQRLSGCRPALASYSVRRAARSGSGAFTGSIAAL